MFFEWHFRPLCVFLLRLVATALPWSGCQVPGSFDGRLSRAGRRSPTCIGGVYCSLFSSFFRERREIKTPLFPFEPTLFRHDGRILLPLLQATFASETWGKSEKGIENVSLQDLAWHGMEQRSDRVRFEACLCVRAIVCALIRPILRLSARSGPTGQC